MAEIKMKLELPLLPNFFRVAGVPDMALPLRDIPAEVITDLANEWCDALLAKAEEARKAPRPRTELGGR